MQVGEKEETVTMGRGRTPTLGSEASEAALHLLFMAFLGANSPIFVILTITNKVGTTIFLILQMEKLRTIEG